MADAQDLPFDDAQFDVILCESVETFIEDKQQVVGEFARVVKLGGYVGLNEEIWLEAPPADIVTHVKGAWEIKPDIPTADDWTVCGEEVARCEARSNDCYWEVSVRWCRPSFCSARRAAWIG